MFSSFTTLTKRLLGGARPGVEPQVIDSVSPDDGEEWTSLDLDPELGRFGAPAAGAIVVPQEAAATLVESPVVEAAVAAVAAEAAVDEPGDDVASLAGPSTEPVTLSMQLMTDEELVDEELPISLSAPEEPGAPALPAAADVVTPVAAASAPAVTDLAPKKAKAKPKKAVPKKPAVKSTAGTKKAAKLKAGGAVAPKRPSFSSFNKGAWQLPGVNGFVCAPHDDSVENVRLDFALQAESAAQ